MVSLNNGFPLKYLLMSFSTLVFHYTVVLLLTNSCTGQSQEVGSSQTITALVGEDVILPCHLEPAADVVSKSLEWGRLDLEPRFVHVWHEGQNHLVNQNPAYEGRTSLSAEKLKHGDLSLTLSAVKHSDNGEYRCYFPSQGKTSTVELVVGSVSSPVIAGININSSVVVLQCESKGWYPEPELLWLDSEGNPLSAGPTETVRGLDDIYTVSSRVTVEKRHSSNINCRVQQRYINQIRETLIEVTAECFAVTSFSAVRISIILIVLFIFTTEAAFCFWDWRQNRIKETKMHRERETEQKETEQLLAETKKKEKKAKLDEELQKKEEEQKHWEQVVNMLTEQNNELKKLQDQLKGQNKNIEREQKEMEKLQSVDKETERDRVKGYLVLKEIILEAKRQLVQRKNEHKQLELNTETLANKIDVVIKTMTEKKKEIDKQKAEISLQLERVGK